VPGAQKILVIMFHLGDSENLRYVFYLLENGTKLYYFSQTMLESYQRDTDQIVIL
jgi:hypothetical protein